MKNPRRRGALAHKAAMRILVTMLLLPFAIETAHAQATAGDGAPSEAARRAAASPYRFILQNANAPARKPAAPAKAEAEPARRAAPPSEPAPVQAAARAVAPAPAALPAPAPVVPAAAAPAPQPEPVVTAARAPKPPEPPARREIIPVRTDEPHLSAALLRERPNGVVKVQFDINPDGSTGGVKVLSSTNRSLNRPTVDAVTLWKFEPVDDVLTVETEVAYRYD